MGAVVASARASAHMPSHRLDSSSAAAANDEVFPFFGIKTPRARLDLEQKLDRQQRRVWVMPLASSPWDLMGPPYRKGLGDLSF